METNLHKLQIQSFWVDRTVRTSTTRELNIYNVYACGCVREAREEIFSSIWKMKSGMQRGKGRLEERSQSEDTFVF